MKHILVTGGAGYIGSHTLIELIEHGFKPVVVDDLSNSSQESIKRVERITGTTIPFYVHDLRVVKDVDALFVEYSFTAVIHFAGLKAVGESTQLPLKYYDTNLNSTLTLLQVMHKHKVKRLVFSSSATVYGTSDILPLTEQSPIGIGITNPYGRTKYFIECILNDFSKANQDFNITILRYFNPIGAHESGLIGEDPNGTPNNLLPYISQVAVGKLSTLTVFGNDYDTPDGTGIRDYIHVVDIAKGHVAALEHEKNGVSVYNLGTGKGTSVLELIKSFELASGKTIAYKIDDRRPGDIATCYADPALARNELGWTAKKSIANACRDSWNWQKKNPHGYQ